MYLNFSIFHFINMSIVNVFLYELKKNDWISPVFDIEKKVQFQ